jgi:hypothetical protein
MPKSNKLLPRYILDIASRLANLSPALGPFSYGNKNVYVLAALSIKRRADKNNKKSGERGRQAIHLTTQHQHTYGESYDKRFISFFSLFPLSMPAP